MREPRVRASRLSSYMYLGRIESVNGFVWILWSSNRWNVYARVKENGKWVTKKLGSFSTLNDLLKLLRKLGLSKPMLRYVKTHYEELMFMQSVRQRLQERLGEDVKKELNVLGRLDELRDLVSRLLDAVNYMAEVRLFLMRIFDVFVEVRRRRSHVLDELPVLRDAINMYVRHVIYAAKERLENDRILKSIRAEPTSEKERSITYCKYLAKIDEIAARIAEMLGMQYNRVYS